MAHPIEQIFQSMSADEMRQPGKAYAGALLKTTLQQLLML